MKNILYTTIIVIALGTSCTKFLDSPMKSDYSSDNYFTSEESAVMAVTGVYNSLYGIKWWIFGDVASDDAVKGGNPGDQADINAIDDFSATSDNGAINTFWKQTYETISQANNVIEYVAPMSIPSRNRLVGEAKFIRAFSYFQLVNIVGKVPYKTKPQISAGTVHVGLSEVNVIYSKIEQDLKEAAAALQTSPTTEKGRVTQGAALAMLAKVYLYQKKYNECLTEITNLETLNQYRLVHQYKDLFQAGAEDSVEVIFGLRFINTTEVTLGNEFNQWMAPSSESGYYFNAPTQDYVDCFTEKTTDGEDDPRLDASIGQAGKPWFNGKTFDASWSEATGYLVKKYNEENPLKRPIAQSTVPYHYLRYADVLLMKAEAMFETADIAGATTALNTVRERVNLPTTATATQAAIRTERRRELGFECHRFFDLMRWGQTTAEEALNGTGFTWKEPRFYFPLPQMELDANQAM